MKLTSAGTAHYCVPPEIKHWQGNKNVYLHKCHKFCLEYFLPSKNFHKKLLKINYGLKCIPFKLTFLT
jgi:hypothetical protein